MRILHTSDWHVGKGIRGRSRAGEHRAVLAEIAQVARSEKVQLVLVAGDVFDSAAPSPEAEEIAYQAILDLADTGAHVVVIGGNHDSAGRLRAIAPLLARARVVVAPTVTRPDQGGVVTVAGGDGDTARVALVPFVSQRGIVKAADLMDTEGFERSQSYTHRMGEIIGTLCSGLDPDAVNVVCGHMWVPGSDLGGGERGAHVRDEYAVSPNSFPSNLHYVALGHVHRAQDVGGAVRARYCGSPLQFDFGEEQNEPSVTLVDAVPGRPAEVRVIPLSAGRRLRTLRGDLAALTALAGSTDDDFLRIVVDEPLRAGLADEVREVFPDAVEVRLRRSDQPAGPGPEIDPHASPSDLFGAFLQHEGIEDARLAALFDEILDEVGT